MRMEWLVIGATLWLASNGAADVRGCVCDVARPETLQDRVCSLCRVAETQPAGGPEFFLVHDASPKKPTRWLVLPRAHGSSPGQLDDLSAAQRAAYWSLAIAKATEVWHGDWGLAINGLAERSQCHLHIHIGKLLPGAENGEFVMVKDASEFPVPPGGKGIWVHPVPGGFHVHLGDDAPELRLQN
jgi:hypothetical protein